MGKNYVLQDIDTSITPYVRIRRDPTAFSLFK